MGFDITRYTCAAPEPWAEYADSDTGQRWGGWLAASEAAHAEHAALHAEVAELRDAVMRAPLYSTRLNASRYQMLRRGQHWSVINGIGDTLRADYLDAAIDAAIAAQGADHG